VSGLLLALLVLLAAAVGFGLGVCFTAVCILRNLDGDPQP